MTARHCFEPDAFPFVLVDALDELEQTAFYTGLLALRFLAGFLCLASTVLFWLEWWV